MKSIKLIVGVIFLVVLFAGCSIVPQNSSGGTSTFTFSQSIWKSMDGGVTWKVENKGTGKANTTGVAVLSLIVNPYDGNNAYAGLKSGGIMETKNGGETWNFLANFTSEKVYGLALSTIDGKTLYVSAVWQGTGKIFKTIDDGATWQEIYTSPSKGPLVISLMTDKKNTNWLYATTSDNQVIKSEDAGTSWKNIYAATAPVLKITGDATDSNLLYAVMTNGTVLRTHDGGKTFENIDTQVGKATNTYGGSGAAVLEADPSVAGRVYLAGSNGLLVSNDGGETWKSMATLNNPQTFPIKTLAVNPQNSQEIIYGAVQASYRSTDGGNTWVTAQFDNDMSARILQYNPSNSSEIYLGFTN